MIVNSGCDLPSHLYSFSFNLNPNWSKELCEQPEILQCMCKLSNAGEHCAYR